jgi:hypothetical protein
MSIKFNIGQTAESEFHYGLYTIYILGGHHIETNSDFFIEVENIANGEKIELTEKKLKVRDFKHGKKAIKFYEFQINEYGKFKITVHNYIDIIVKESILEAFPFPFSIPHQILSAIIGRSQKPIAISDIEILIT